MKVKVEPLSSSIEQIMAGLDKLRLIRRMKEDESGFKLIFCYSEALIWTFDLFVSNLIPNWSEDGSNQKKVELSVYRAFIDMCEICFHDGNNSFFITLGIKNVLRYHTMVRFPNPCFVCNRIKT